MKKVLWLLLLIPAIPAFAVIPQFWEVRTYDEFRQGELEGLSVNGDGSLVLAPAFDLVFDTQTPLIFSAAADSQGNVYLGTGHDGKVYRIGSDGSGDVWVDLDELDVMAIAVSDDGEVFAATSPNGRVYRITAGGDAEVFFEPDTRYIWSLMFDASGRLLVATGDEGVIYRVGPNGEGEVFYDSDETHILTMALDSSGNVIVGGDPKGYVYRISPGGQAFVLYNSGMREVHSIVVDEDDTIYAAVLTAGGAIPREVPASVSAASEQETPISITIENAREDFNAQRVQVGSASVAASPRGRGGVASADGVPASRSRIVQIDPGGEVTRLWDSDEEMVFALLPHADRLLFSTGTKGRVYALDSPQRAALLLESPEEQTTQLLSSRDRLFASSSNTAKLFEIGPPASSGSYQSVVKDTGTNSSWGTVAWAGRGAEILTRSGNTSSPDRTWSEWAALAPDGHVQSPNARFVQWRAVLTADGDEDPLLTALRLPYLQQNFRPEVRGLDVLRSGIALENLPTANNNAGSPSAVGDGVVSGRVFPNRPRVPTRTLIRPGAQSLNWEARDENGDDLVYSILYRAENEQEWKLLEGGLADSFYTIEPDTLPDGMYVFRVVASDIGSNPPELALTGERDTVPFAIDSTPPTVSVEQRGIENRRANIYVEANDGTSTLKQAEVSVDAGVWRPVFPVDGIVDSRSETFQFASVELAAGEHVVAFRIYDQNENVGIGKVVVRIP